jgi:hypothetical protein
VSDRISLCIPMMALAMWFASTNKMWGSYVHMKQNSKWDLKVKLCLCASPCFHEDITFSVWVLQ